MAEWTQADIEHAHEMHNQSCCRGTWEDLYRIAVRRRDEIERAARADERRSVLVEVAAWLRAHAFDVKECADDGTVDAIVPVTSVEEFEATWMPEGVPQ